jgi:hypothetical protein
MEKPSSGVSINSARIPLGDHLAVITTTTAWFFERWLGRLLEGMAEGVLNADLTAARCRARQSRAGAAAL